MVISSTKRFRRRYKSFLTYFRDAGKIYCENTTLHGFRYIINKNSSIPGKLLWLTISLLGVGLCVYFTYTVWERFILSPAVISVESTAYPMWDFPFPAVTICNFNKADKDRADDLAKKMVSLGMNNSEIQCLLDAVPAMVNENYVKRDYHRGIETLKRVGLGPEDMMYNLMQPCDKLLLECLWQSQKYNCTDLFKTVKSYMGFCCSFNYHVLEGGYSKASPSNSSNLPNMSQPLKIPGAGPDASLFVVLNVEQSKYRSTVRPTYGASVIIHEPRTYPEINIRTQTVEPGKHVSVYLSGSTIESAESLRRLSLKQRQCWFDDEIKLNTTALYRYEACITERRMEHIYAKCDCIPFYYPNTMRDARICGLVDVPCLRRNKGSLAMLETADYDKLNESISKEHWIKCRNDCKPQCTDRSYAIRMQSSTFMKNEKLLKNFVFQKTKITIDFENHSVLQVYFPDITCMKYRRESVMTWENLLAAFGGIFGLCVGGSFVSVVELLFFLIKHVYGAMSSRMTSARNVKTVQVQRLGVKPLKGDFPCAWNDFVIRGDFNIHRNVIAGKLVNGNGRSPFIIDLARN